MTWILLFAHILTGWKQWNWIGDGWILMTWQFGVLISGITISSAPWSMCVSHISHPATDHAGTMHPGVSHGGTVTIHLSPGHSPPIVHHISRHPGDSKHCQLLSISCLMRVLPLSNSWVRVNIYILCSPCTIVIQHQGLLWSEATMMQRYFIVFSPDNVFMCSQYSTCGDSWAMAG